MDYKEKYEHGLECIQEILSGAGDSIKTSILRKRLQPFFRELKESEDERIRKAIKKALQVRCDGSRIISDEPVTLEEALAWLEKQAENKKVSIWKHWKNGIAGNGEGRQVYLIRTGNTYDLSSCLGFECDYIELSELDNLMLEKQGEKKPTDKTESKFNPGDWITDGHLTCKVLSVTGKSYELHLYNDDYCHFETDIQSVDKHYCLWTIKDAKDGDVLVCEDENFTIPFIAIYKCLGDTVYDYKGLKEVTFISHCFMGFNGNFYEGEGGHVIEGIHPATKEQRDMLFQKMEEAGYVWDADKKGLKKIESSDN